MFNWISSIFGSQDEIDGDSNKYGFQMSMTLSNHPFLDEYRENIRAYNRKFRKFKPQTATVDCEPSRGRQNYPTIIVRSNESVSSIQSLFCKTDPFHNEEQKVMDSLTDTTYFGQTVYIKDEKCKEVDPILFKPFKFGPEYSFSRTLSTKIFWNVPLIFIGFDRENHKDIYEMFLDILNWNPIGKGITSIEFLDYMSQPVVFWIRTKRELEIRWKNYYLIHPNLDHDLLEYKIMSNITIHDKVFKMLRESYLETMGRRLLNPSGSDEHMFLESA